MEAKFSLYNWLYDVYGSYYIYNNMTGAIAELDTSEYNTIIEMSNTKDTFSIDLENDDLLASLYNAKFVIDADSNELAVDERKLIFPVDDN